MLLVGITGSGKTTLAQALVERGLVRLSVDDEVHRPPRPVRRRLPRARILRARTTRH
ncbi:MAG: AAA family ATPase [Pseudonocardiaceae bacterium]